MQGEPQALQQVWEGRQRRQTQRVVRDRRTHHPVGLHLGDVLGSVRKQGVQVSGQQEGAAAPGAGMDGGDVAQIVLHDVGQAELAEPFLQEVRSLLLAERGRRDLRDHGQLRKQGMAVLEDLLSQRRQPAQDELERR